MLLLLMVLLAGLDAGGGAMGARAGPGTGAFITGMQ